MVSPANFCTRCGKIAAFCIHRRDQLIQAIRDSGRYHVVEAGQIRTSLRIDEMSWADQMESEEGQSASSSTAPSIAAEKEKVAVAQATPAPVQTTVAGISERAQADPDPAAAGAAIKAVRPGDASYTSQYGQMPDKNRSKFSRMPAHLPLAVFDESRINPTYAQASRRDLLAALPASAHNRLVADRPLDERSHPDYKRANWTILQHNRQIVSEYFAGKRATAPAAAASSTAHQIVRPVAAPAPVAPEAKPAASAPAAAPTAGPAPDADTAAAEFRAGLMNLTAIVPRMKAAPGTQAILLQLLLVLSQVASTMSRECSCREAVTPGDYCVIAGTCYPRAGTDFRYNMTRDLCLGPLDAPDEVCSRTRTLHAPAVFCPEPMHDWWFRDGAVDFLPRIDALYEFSCGEYLNFRARPPLACPAVCLGKESFRITRHLAMCSTNLVVQPPFSVVLSRPQLAPTIGQAVGQAFESPMSTLATVSLISWLAYLAVLPILALSRPLRRYVCAPFWLLLVCCCRRARACDFAVRAQSEVSGCIPTEGGRGQICQTSFLATVALRGPGSSVCLTIAHEGLQATVVEVELTDFSLRAIDAYRYMTADWEIKPDGAVRCPNVFSWCTNTGIATINRDGDRTCAGDVTDMAVLQAKGYVRADDAAVSVIGDGCPGAWLGAFCGCVCWSYGYQPRPPYYAAREITDVVIEPELKITVEGQTTNWQATTGDTMAGPLSIRYEGAYAGSTDLRGMYVLTAPSAGVAARLVRAAAPGAPVAGVYGDIQGTNEGVEWGATTAVLPVGSASVTVGRGRQVHVVAPPRPFTTTQGTILPGELLGATWMWGGKGLIGHPNRVPTVEITLRSVRNLSVEWRYDDVTVRLRLGKAGGCYLCERFSAELFLAAERGRGTVEVAVSGADCATLRPFINETEIRLALRCRVSSSRNEVGVCAISNFGRACQNATWYADAPPEPVPVDPASGTSNPVSSTTTRWSLIFGLAALGATVVVIIVWCLSRRCRSPSVSVSLTAPVNRSPGRGPIVLPPVRNWSGRV